MSTREEKKQATRQKLLDAADRLIIEKGYDQLSVEDLTQASGIAKGTFYNYFERKEDIIGELSRLRFRPLNHSIRENAAQLGALPALQQYIQDYCQIIQQSGLARLRSWIQFAIYPNQAESKWELDVQVLIDALEQLKSDRLLSYDCPSIQLARSIMSHLYGLMLVWTLEEEPSLSQTVQNFIQEELPLLLSPYLPSTKN